MGARTGAIAAHQEPVSLQQESPQPLANQDVLKATEGNSNGPDYYNQWAVQNSNL
jgi:hypothetical protein